MYNVYRKTTIRKTSNLCFNLYPPWCWPLCQHICAMYIRARIYMCKLFSFVKLLLLEKLDKTKKFNSLKILAFPLKFELLKFHCYIFVFCVQILYSMFCKKNIFSIRFAYILYLIFPCVVNTIIYVHQKRFPRNYCARNSRSEYILLF